MRRLKQGKGFIAVAKKQKAIAFWLDIGRYYSTPLLALLGSLLKLTTASISSGSHSRIGACVVRWNGAEAPRSPPAPGDDCVLDAPRFSSCSKLSMRRRRVSISA